MKTYVISLALLIIALSGQSTFAQGACASGAAEADLPSTAPYHTPLPGSSSTPIVGSLPAQSQASVPAVPRARITVVHDSSEGKTASHRVPAARLTLIAETAAASLTEAAEATSAVVQDSTKPVVPGNAVGKSGEEQDSLPPVLKDLVGTWLAVARHGDGELTTIELQLDNRGWAKLTLPGTDGKPSSTEHRLEFEDDQLKLNGPDGEQRLGKLIEVNHRQMVLARADGRITFVRL